MKNRNLWLIIGLLIAVILLLFMCRKQKEVIPQKPDVVTVYQIQQSVTKDTIAYNKLRDSFKFVVNRLNLSLKSSEVSLLNEQLSTYKLQQDNEFLLSKLNTSELTDDLIAQAAKIKRNGELKDSISSAVKANLLLQISSKDSQLIQSELLTKSINKSLDTCLKNQSLLNSYADKLKPRNKVALGFVANVYPYAGIGFGVDFINKKNVIYSANTSYMQKNWYIQIGLKKVISFR